MGYTNRHSKIDNIELRNRISQALIGRYTGENNPNYKGYNSEKEIARGIFKTISKRLFRERGYKCEHCGKHGGRLETPFPYAFNLEKAKKLMVEAGFPDGIDPKTGKHVVIQLAIGRATQSAREQAELMQSFYEKIGVRLETQFMTWAAYLKAVSDGNV